MNDFVRQCADGLMMYDEAKSIAYDITVRFRHRGVCDEAIDMFLREIGMTKEECEERFGKSPYSILYSY